MNEPAPAASPFAGKRPLDVMKKLVALYRPAD